MNKQARQINRIIVNLTYKEGALALLANLDSILESSRSSGYRETILNMLSDFELRERIKYASKNT